MATETNRRNDGIRAALLGVAANLLLSIVKGVAGVLGNSHALVADAVNSVSDVVGSVLVWLGMRWAVKPPDADHPYGHGRAETLAAAAVGILLVVAAAQIMWSGVNAFLAEPGAVPAAYTGVFAGLAIVVKEALYRYNVNLGERLNSPALIANAHDHRSDVVSSIVALLGIAGAQLSVVAGVPWLARLDAGGSLIVGLIILRTAWVLVYAAFTEVMDKQVDPDELSEYRNLVLSVSGVEDVSDLRVRTYGHYRVIDAKIAVRRWLSVDEGHSIAARVKDAILEAHPSETLSVLVHVNPHRS